MERRRFLSAIGASLSVAAAGCLSDESTPVSGDADSSEDEGEDETATETATETPTETPTETLTEESEPDVEILEHEWTVIEEYESDAVEDDYGVVGVGQNNAEVALDIFIEFRFYDADDIQLDDFTFNTNGVQPGDKFHFEAPYLGDDPDDVERYEYEWEAFEA